MNLPPSSQRIPSRKARLYSQLYQAKEVNNEELLFSLESQCVHRYGFESLNDLNNVEQQRFVKVTSQKESLECSPLLELSDQKNYTSSPLEDIGDEEPTVKCEQINDVSAIVTDSENVDISSIIGKSETSNDLEIESSKVIAPPPPTPSISHLRRWLTSVEDEIPKAS